MSQNREVYNIKYVCHDQSSINKFKTCSKFFYINGFIHWSQMTQRITECWQIWPLSEVYCINLYKQSVFIVLHVEKTVYYCYMWWLMSIPTLRSGISTTTWPSTSHSHTKHTLHKHRQLSYEMPPPRQVVYIIHGYRLKVSKVMHSKQPLSYSLQLLLYRLAVQLFAVCSNFSVYLEMCCLVCTPA